MRIVARAEPTGLLLFDADSTVLVELTRWEARALGYGGSFPQSVSAPRFVHIEVTSRCNMRCEDCYVEPGSEEMDAPQVKRLLAEFAQMQTFQVAFGGGEPFMRSDFLDLVEYAASLGLVVTATTNGTLLKDDSRLALFRQINASYHGNLEALEQTLALVQKYTAAGVNLVMSRSEKALHEVASICKERGAELLLLAYKPVSGNWENLIEPEELMKIAKELSLDGLRVAVDGYTCSRCVAAQHFVDVAASGDVYPCSFIRRPIGNVLTEPFKKIWDRRQSHVPSRCPFRRGQESERSVAAT